MNEMRIAHTIFNRFRTNAFSIFFFLHQNESNAIDSVTLCMQEQSEQNEAFASKMNFQSGGSF